MDELEEYQICNKEDVPVRKLCAESTTDAIDDVNSNFTYITKDLLISMKRDDLKEELQLRGQLLSSNKDTLITRLYEALENKKGIGCNNKDNSNKIKNNTKETKKLAGMRAFCKGAYWEILKANNQPVEEVANINFKRARSPTILEEDCMCLPVKYNFSNNKFDVPQF